MKHNEFIELDKKINNQNFNKSYKSLNYVMFFLSIFGHLVSIFLAYFALSSIIKGVIDSLVVISIISIILLTGLELLKRDLFNKFSIQFLRNSGFGKAVFPIFIAALMISSISFVATISGAKEISMKRKIIDETKKEITTNYNDSISKVYDLKIQDIENEIRDNKDKIDAKDKEQTELEAVQPLTYYQRNRVRDLKQEKTSLKEDNTKLESDIESLKLELDYKIKQHELKIEEESEGMKKDNKTNSLVFILLSTLIEFLILTGIYFNEYYKFRSYKEFKLKIDGDPNYQKWMLYDKILNVIFNDETRINQKLPSNKSIIDICKVNGIILLPKDITDFLKIITNINILKTAGSSRYFNKSKEASIEILKRHFNID